MPGFFGILIPTESVYRPTTIHVAYSCHFDVALFTLLMYRVHVYAVQQSAAFAVPMLFARCCLPLHMIGACVAPQPRAACTAAGTQVRQRQTNPKQPRFITMRPGVPTPGTKRHLPDDAACRLALNAHKKTFIYNRLPH
jgi:hypothetical protein